MKTISLIVLTALLIGCSLNAQKEANPEVQTLSLPAGNNSSLPFLTKDEKGRLLISWVERQDKLTFLKFSTLDLDTWSTPKMISSGDNWFVNWADYPSVARADNHMISHFLAKSGEGTYSYDVHLTQSNDGGENWGMDYVPHKDGTPTEHGFVTLIPYDDGFFAAWLDGRNTENSREEGGQGAMTVRGAFISATGEITAEALLDNRVCDCCQTGGAITQNGPIVVYRDRSDEEVRDMSIVRYINGQWTDPKVIHRDDWKIAGCPVNGPRASSFGSSLAVAWFSAPHQKSQVKVIFSSDNGETFDQPISIDDTSPIGRVDVVMLDRNSAMVSWLDKGDNTAELKAVRIFDNGQVKDVHNITTMDLSRQSGFPQMEVVDDRIFFAWTDVISDTESRVKTAFFKY